MERHIGQIPTNTVLLTNPTMFQVGDNVRRIDMRSSSIGKVVYVLIAARAYGITYKYLIQIDTDLYIIDEADLQLYLE